MFCAYFTVSFLDAVSPLLMQLSFYSCSPKVLVVCPVFLSSSFPVCPFVFPFNSFRKRGMESTKIRKFYLSFPYSVSLTMELIFHEVFPLNILGNVTDVTRSQNCKIMKYFLFFSPQDSWPGTKGVKSLKIQIFGLGRSSRTESSLGLSPLCHIQPLKLSQSDGVRITKRSRFSFNTEKKKGLLGI